MKINKQFIRHLPYRPEFEDVEYLVTKLARQDTCEKDEAGKYCMHLQTYNVKGLGISIRPVLEATPVVNGAQLEADLSNFEVNVVMGKRTIRTSQTGKFTLLNDPDNQRSILTVDWEMNTDDLPALFYYPVSTFLDKLVKGYVDGFVENVSA